MAADAPVSVVIPCYNRADRIEGAIRSAVSQDPAPFEIIVVDDCSTDGVDLAKLAAMDRRVRTIRHPANRGSAGARNTGIDAAQGKWIAFLDADDLWLPGKLARQMEQLEGLDERMTFACSNVRLDGRAAGSPLYNDRPPHEGEDISRYFLLYGCTFQTSTLLVPAERARAIRFDQRFVPHEDWDFSLRLIRSGTRFVYCHEPLACYWDGANPKRLSKRPSIAPSLFWIRAAGDLIAADAAAAYYFRKAFRQHVGQNPAAALLTGLKLTFGSTRAAAWVFGKLGENLRDRLMPGRADRNS